MCALTERFLFYSCARFSERDETHERLVGAPLVRAELELEHYQLEGQQQSFQQQHWHWPRHDAEWLDVVDARERLVAVNAARRLVSAGDLSARRQQLVAADERCVLCLCALYKYNVHQTNVLYSIRSNYCTVQYMCTYSGEGVRLAIPQHTTPPVCDR